MQDRIDAIFDLDQEIKGLKERRDELAAPLKDLESGDYEGFTSIAKVVHKMDWRLDTKSLKSEMGEAWYEKRCKIVKSSSVRTRAQ